MNSSILKTARIVLHKVESVYLITLLSALVVLSFAQISGRLILNVGFSWADPIINHLVLWSALAGALMATRTREHITIDIVQRLLSHRNLIIVQILTMLFSAFISGVLVVAAVRFLIDEYASGPMILTPFRSWVFQIPIPVSFFFIGMRFLFLAIERIVELGSGDGRR